MDREQNVSYVFIPFAYEKKEQFPLLTAALDQSRLWAPFEGNDAMYLLKYVADKFSFTDPSRRLCAHYCLRQESLGALGLGEPGAVFSYGDGEEQFTFRFLRAHVYCFNTTVGIIALALHFEDSSPFEIANAQYLLKKISRGRFGPVGTKACRTFLELVEEMMEQLPGANHFDYFFHAQTGRERANLLTYIEVPPNGENGYRKELFYLRHCYGKAYLYKESEASDPNELYCPSPGIQWGISSEAAVCLTSPMEGAEDFIHGKFYENFNSQYLLMYVLLLHQKYVLYLFLTQATARMQADLQTMEKYRRQLYEFEMNFIFSSVTEVPQYQELYSRITQAFSLTQLFENVHNPLHSLSELRQKALEAQQKERDESVNKALLLLSVLSFFSALVDSLSFAETFFGLFLAPVGVRIAQGVCLTLVLVAGFFVIRYLWRSEHK